MASMDVTRSSPGGTRQNLEGPFHRDGAPVREDGCLFDKAPPETMTRLLMSGRVLDAATGEPLEGAVLDIWQADGEGVYDHDGFQWRGIVRSKGDGSYGVETVVPRDYSEHDGDPIGELFSAMGRHNRRAAHIHLMASHPGYVSLTTQIFMPNSQHLKDDYVEGAVSEDLTLRFEPVAGSEGRAVQSRFDIRLAKA
jgi:catechol 1,2-dioxygenase